MNSSPLPPDLEEFADELRSALEDPALPSDLRTRLSSPRLWPWTFRGAVQNNRVLRTAASVLILLCVSVPVMAVIALMESRSSDLPILQFEPVPQNLPSDSVRELPLVPIVPPDPVLVDPLDDAWAAAVRVENTRLRWLQSWTPAARAVAPWCPLPAAAAILLEQGGS